MPETDVAITKVTISDLERFSKKFVMSDSCWLWTAGRSTGYGRFRARGASHLAHTFLYQVLKGLNATKTLDHLCENRLCVNPAHLEPTTRGENVLRSNKSTASINKSKTHCKHGHEFTVENTYVRPDGDGRQCLTCDHNRRKRG